MAINQTLNGVNVDSSADNGKYVKYDGATDTLVMGTPSGGGGTPEVAYIYLSVDQTSNKTSGNHIEFDTISNVSGSGITLATGSGQADGIVTLPSGKTFKLQAFFAGDFNSSSGQMYWQFYDRTNAVLIGAPSDNHPLTYPADIFTCPPATAYITTSASTDVELQIVGSSNMGNFYGAGSGVWTFMTVESI